MPLPSDLTGNPDAAKNCNTCSNLERIEHTKNKFGFLQGRCLGTPDIPTDLYGSPIIKQRKDIITFHPNDVLLMPCHKQRDLIIK